MLPEGTGWRFTPSLFASPAFLQLLPEAHRHSYYLLGSDDFMVRAVVHFWVENSRALSPLRAPFGGVEMADFVPNDILEPFLRFVLLQLENTGVQQWVVRLAPAGIEPWHSSLHVPVLMKLGFRLTEAEVNHHLFIHPGAFATGLHHSLRRRLNNCRQAGYAFSEESAEQLEEVGAFIGKTRNQEGLSFGMTPASLQQQFGTLPDACFLFTVRDEGRIIAASVGVRLDERVLYSFGLVQDQEYAAASPLVLLTEGLYNWAADHHYQVLDLGTSALPDGPDYPLITLKERLGGVPSLRLKFQKSVR